MKFAGVRVGARTRFLYDGDVMEVVEIHCTTGSSELLAREVRTGTVRRFALDEVMYSRRARLLSEDFGGGGGVGSHPKRRTYHLRDVKMADPPQR
jgi:hypothetical protein